MAIDSTKNVLKDRYIVINADDFGLSREVNKGILAAHKKGCLTSTSLMANGPMFRQGVEMSRSVPRLGIGIHLNLLRGKPISKLQLVSRLVDERGIFPGTVTSMMRRFMQSSVALDQAEHECMAQIEQIIQTGIRPTHIDSEKHLHMYPPLFKRVARLAVSYGIRWIRIVEENSISWKIKFTITQMGKSFLLGRFARSCRKIAKTTDLKSSDNFYGVLHAGHMVKDVYDDIFERMLPGVTEIVCHPGFNGESNTDSDLGLYFLEETRQDELNTLLDKTLIDKMRNKKINLVNFGDLI